MMSSADAFRNIPWLHLRVGDPVHLDDDPRHTGRIVAIHNSAVALIRWDETNWRSEEPLHQLRKVS